IGYVELIYAVQNKIPYGTVKNSSGNFVKASLESVTAAAASAKSMPADFRVSITNAPGKDAYPISSFTWLLIPEKSKDPTKGKILDVQQKARTRTLYYLVNTPVTRDEPYYELTVQVRDTVYVAEYTPRHSADTLPDDWRTGTEIQLKADKRHLLVKRPGEAQADLVVVKHMPAASWKAPPQDPPADK